MAKKKVTFADIAAYTNFSKTTISRYFNNPDSLTLENQEKIAGSSGRTGISGKQTGQSPCQRKKRICRNHHPQSLSSLLFRNLKSAFVQLLKIRL